MLRMCVTAIAVVGLFAGFEVVLGAVALPLPPSIAAMLALFAWCVARGGVPPALGRLCDRALPWLPLYFVPVCVFALWDLGGHQEAVAVVVAFITLGTGAVGGLTALVVRLRRPATQATETTETRG